MIILSETWCIDIPTHFSNYLPNLQLVCIPAIKIPNQRGRPKGGLILAHKGNISICKTTSNAIFYRFNDQRDSPVFIAVYAPPDQYGDNLLSPIYSEIANDDSINGHIIIGDLNARIANFSPAPTEHYTQVEARNAQFNSRGLELVNFISENGWIILNGASKSDPNGEFTFSNHNGSSVIDICISSPSSSNYILDFDVLLSPISCHSPIRLTTLGNGTETTQTHHSSLAEETLHRIKWDSQKQENFATNFNNEMDLLHNTWDWDTLSKAIAQSAKTVNIMKSVPLVPDSKIHNAKWFDSECSDAKEEVWRLAKASRRHYQTKHRHEIIQQFLERRRLYQQLKMEKKKKHNDQLLSRIINAKDSFEFWSALKNFRPHNTNVNNITKDKWHEHFSSLFSNKHQDDVDETATPTNLDPNSDLDAPITDAELSQAIKKLKPRKAPGFDGIPNEVYKTIAIRHKSGLLHLLNNILENGRVPEDWCKIIISPIFKKGDKCDPSNYRPISLISTGLKLLTSIISKRLQNWSRREGKVSEFQTGFKEGVGTQEQIFALTTLIQSSIKDKGGKLFVAYLDLKSAFDSPPHSKLWKSLANKGVGPKILKLFQNLYSSANAQVKSANGLSQPFQIGQGVLQGDSASCFLFNIFFDTIIDNMHNSEIPGVSVGSCLVHLLAYADDAALVATTPQQLQNKLDLAASTFKKLGLTLNIKKTKVSIYSKRLPKSEYAFTWEGEPIEIVSDFTYLGVTFHRNGNFSKATNHSIAKSTAACEQILQITRRAKIPTIDTHKKLFSSLAKSVLLYAANIWALNHLDAVEKVHCYFWKKLLRLPKCTPGYVVRLETGTTHTTYSKIKCTLKFLQRLVREESSFLSQCLRWQLRWAPRITTCAKSWGKSLKSVLADLAGDHTLDLPFSEIAIQLPKKSSEILARVKAALVNRDTSRMLNSSWTPTYSKMKTHATTEFYLNANLALQTVQITSQLRANLFSLKIFDKRIPLQNKSNCPWCLNDAGNADHYLFECEPLRPQRSYVFVKYLSQFITNKPSNDWRFTDLYNSNASSTMLFKNIFYFFLESSRILPD